MKRHEFLYNFLTPEDHRKALAIVGGLNGPQSRFLREPDLVISPEGLPYLYRWHVIPRNETANVYLHVQTGSDPARPLHDHEYDNQSVILAGGYTEVIQKSSPGGMVSRCTRLVGETIHRKAEEAHRLLLPPGVPYTMSLFTTGPRRREWGFWQPAVGGDSYHPATPAKWLHWSEVVEDGPYKTTNLKETTDVER